MYTYKEDLRGPPLDENLLLSNIATANKKVKHLSEAGKKSRKREGVCNH